MVHDTPDITVKITLDSLEQLVQHIVELRGVDTPCSACSGLVVDNYPSTATWHGGMGGMAITQDVCCKCWGSGDANKPWLNHRVALQKIDELQQRIEELNKS